MIPSFAKNILVADPDQRRSLRAAIILKRLEYNVFVASESAELLRIADYAMPNLILLDLRMPFVGNRTCLEAIRSERGLDPVKVITTADIADEPLLKESLKKGANDFLIRPFGPTGLYRKIQTLTETQPREAPRLRVIFRATVTAGHTARTAYATMISERGVFIRTMNPFEAGTHVLLSLDLPSAKPLVLDGEVIYQVSLNRERFSEPGMGVRFVNLPPEVRMGLKAFIESQLTGDLEPEMMI
ncbi:MAG: PilZ domain-containing protein [Deltaproteobacteria bacterium]|nr:PilZ domain-containing protein [Deltaproteobacteria bacterium]